MPTDEGTRSDTVIDSAAVAAIVREVIARLKSSSTGSETGQLAASINDRVITAQTIQQVKPNVPQVFVAPDAVITPAARDEAKQRGLEIQRSVIVPPPQQSNHARLEITDTDDPKRADAIRSQLARRGVASSAGKIVLSDTPAREVHRQCSELAEVAVMIASVTDVGRFAAEASPTVWVLDMKRLNIVSAVNVIAEITRTGKRTP